MDLRIGPWSATLFHLIAQGQHLLHGRVLLLGDPDVTRVLPAAEIEKAFDLKEQLRNVEAVFKRVFTE